MNAVMKTIRNLLLVSSLGVFALTSCEKKPDLEDLDGKNTVTTNYKEGANFNQQKYYVSDSILVIGDNGTGDDHYFWVNGVDPEATKIISQVKKDMNERSYQALADKDPSAGLAIRLTYVENIYAYVTYFDYWWDYWWGWYYPYYPYPIVYTYTTGSLVLDMIDLTAPPTPGQAPNYRPIIWNGYMTGLLTGNKSYDGNLALQAIDQAFNQSPYVVYR